MARSLFIFRTPTAASPETFPPPSPQTPGFESDLMQATLTLKATTDTVGMFANYGVTDRFDVGIAIPISHVPRWTRMCMPRFSVSRSAGTLRSHVRQGSGRHRARFRCFGLGDRHWRRGREDEIQLPSRDEHLVVAWRRSAIAERRLGQSARDWVQHRANFS